MLYPYLQDFGLPPTVITDEDRSVLGQTMRTFRNLTSESDIVCDLHFNSAGIETAGGVEVLVPAHPTYFEIQLGKRIALAIHRVMGIKLRGEEGIRTELESHHGRLAWMNLTGENILIETCFISNPTEMAKYESVKVEVAYAIGDVLYEFSRYK